MNQHATMPESVILALLVIPIGATLVHHFLARRGLRTARAETQTPTQLPPITVLKPLCGVDEGLHENLKSVITQDYPDFEVIFGVSDWRDPALVVVHRLMRAYPDKALRLVVSSRFADASNPKVANLLNILGAASHDHIVISDSNVRVSEDYLRGLVDTFVQPDTGLVSSLIVGIGGQSMGAAVENLHLNTFVAGAVCSGEVVGRPCVIGKSMLLRRSQLDRLGGLTSMRDMLAEDFALGERYRQAGYRVALSYRPVYAYHHTISAGKFFQRHMRWAQMRRWGTPELFLWEPLLYPTPWFAAAMWVAPAPLQLAPLILCALGARILNDALLARTMSESFPSWRALALIPAKDCALLVIWAIALVRRHVKWRGTAMRIGAGTRVSGIPRAAGPKETTVSVVRSA